MRSELVVDGCVASICLVVMNSVVPSLWLVVVEADVISFCSVVDKTDEVKGAVVTVSSFPDVET